MRRILINLLLGSALVAAVAQPGAAGSRLAKDPYIGAIVVEPITGTVLYEDGADNRAYPASVIKLMTMLLTLERVARGSLRLDEEVRVTAEAARTGGSQVYLAENEVFTVEDLLYALMVQSANDAATALAVHIGGTRDGFVAMMNERARELGMTSTRLQSPHGLPPGRGQQPDVTTARDVARLARELLKHPSVLAYTSTAERGFRDGKFIMRTHNKLLKSFPGCDGLKTGYYWAAGFSVAATAERDGARAIAVVLGSASSQTRDRKSAELLARGLDQVWSAVSLQEDEPMGPFLDVQYR